MSALTPPLNRKRLYEGILVCLIAAFPVYVSIRYETQWVWLVYSFFYGLLTVYCQKRISGYFTIISLFFSALPFLFLGALLLLSFSFQATAFNEAFLYHFNRSGIHGHEARVFLGVFVFILFFAVVSSLSFLLRRRRERRSMQLCYLAIMVTLAFSSPQSISFGKMFYEQYVGASIPRVLQEGDSELDMKVRGIFDDGTGNLEYSVGEKMNVVFVYSESVEGTFSDQELFPGKLNHLDSLKDSSLVFTNIVQTPYTGWTISGIVASLCGLPLQMPLDSSSHNFSLFSEFMANAQCMSDLLQEENYYLAFQGGADLNFAGKGAFLRSHGFDEITGKQRFRESIAENDENYNSWGVRDKALLRSAYDTFLQLSAKEQPFGLFLLTLDTHAPGYPDPSCEVENPSFRENRMLHAVHCSTREIHEFVERVRQSDYSEQTVIVLLSDHLAHWNPATKYLRKKKRRMMFMINYPSSMHATIDELGTHYDVGPTVLQAIGIRPSGALGFGRSMLLSPDSGGAASGRKGFLPEKLKNKGLHKFARHPQVRTYVQKKWSEDLGEINESGLLIDASDFTIKFGQKEISYRNPRYSRITEPGAVLFKLERQGLEVIDITSLKDFVRFPSHFSIQHWFEGSEPLYLYVGGENYLPFLQYEGQPGDSVVAFIDLQKFRGQVRPIRDDLSLSLEYINSAFRQSALGLQRSDESVSSSYRVKSRGDSRVSLLSCLNKVCESHIEDATNNIHKGKWGISVWQMNDKNEIAMLEHINHCRNRDAYEKSPQLEKLVDLAKSNGQEYLFLIGRNSVFCRPKKNLHDWIGDMGLAKLKNIKSKQPYIGIVDLDTLDIEEFTGALYVQAAMGKMFDQPSKENNHVLNEMVSDRSSFCKQPPAFSQTILH